MEFSTWLSETPISTWLRMAPYPFVIMIIIHIMTIAIFGGMVVLGNLRVLGYAMKETPVSQVLNQFRVWKWVGFAILLITGLIMTVSDPVEYYTNIMYWLTLVVVLLAGANAWVFHNGAERTVSEWDTAPVAPPAARRWAWFSIILWVALVGIGRAIAFY